MRRCYVLRALNEDDTVTWHYLVHNTDDDPRGLFRQYLTPHQYETFTIEHIANTTTGKVEYPIQLEEQDQFRFRREHHTVSRKTLTAEQVDMLRGLGVKL